MLAFRKSPADGGQSGQCVLSQNQTYLVCFFVQVRSGLQRQQQAGAQSAWTTVPHRVGSNPSLVFGLRNASR